MRFLQSLIAPFNVKKICDELSEDDMEVAMLKIALEFAQGSDRELLFVKISRNRR